MRPLLRPNGYDALPVLAALALAVLCALGTWSAAADTDLQVAVTVDGGPADRFPLSDLWSESRVYSSNGYTLKIAAAGGKREAGVFVEASDCPSQDCVRTGIIRRGGQCIVCLPARVVIRLEGGAGPDGVDLVIG